MLFFVFLLVLAIFVALNYEAVKSKLYEIFAAIATLFGHSAEKSGGDPAAQTEIEARVVPRALISVKKMRKKLEKLGLKRGEMQKMERKVYVLTVGEELKRKLSGLGGNPIPQEIAGHPVSDDFRKLLADISTLSSDRGFVRVRTDPSRGKTAATVTVKTYEEGSPHATEREFEVDDYEIAAKQVGEIFAQKSEHITFREIFDNSESAPPMNMANEVTIDVVMPVPPYVEIEAKDDQSLQRMVGAVIAALGHECDVYYGAYGSTIGELYGIDVKFVNDKIPRLGPNSAEEFRQHVTKNKDLFEEVANYIKDEFGDK